MQSIKTNPKILPEGSLNNLDTQGTKLELSPESFKIDLSNDVPDPHPLMSINGVIACSPQNISLIRAKAKSGKSFLCSYLIAAWLLRTYSSVESVPLEGKTKIAIIDSEQADAHVYKFARRVHRMCEFDTAKNNPQFEVYAIKDLNNDQRFDILEKVGSDQGIGIIIFDGVVDLIDDFNDIKESAQKKDRILKLVKERNIHLFGVLHTNKQNNDSRGHWGAFWEQKAETVFHIEKIEDYFEVSPAYSRNPPFEKFGFKIQDGLPVDASSIDRPNPNIIKQQNTFRKILTGTNTMGYKELSEEYMAHTGLSESSAKKHIAFHYTNDFLEKNDNGNYWIKNNTEA